MKKKLLICAMTIILAAGAMYGCSKDNNKKDNITEGEKGNQTQQDNVSENVNKNKFDIEVTYSDKEQLSITKNELNKYTNVIELDDKSVTITESGEYVLSGTINDGQIIVDIPESDDKVVTLILNGVDITCNNSAAFYVKNAKKVVLSLVEDTVNSFADNESYTYADVEKEEPNACIFSKDDLVISGNGSLCVTGNFNNGIYSKDDLTITGGKIIVEAVNNGIKGKDSIAVLDTDITINAGGDGLCTSNYEDEGKGFISIEDGTFNITSGEDGMQAETCMEIKNGSFNITTGDGGKVTSWNNNDKWGRNSATSEETVSKKAIKASVDVTISGGEFTINSEDDAIHTNNTINIDNGNFNIESGDDGIHGDEKITINNGEITISQCYEGIEAKNVVINDGKIHITATDDSFNAAGGNDGSSMNGRPGKNQFSAGIGSLEFNGGYIYANSNGDGLDANGTITVNGGYIIVDGPASAGNGALDFDGTFNMNNGFVLAVGYNGMSQMPTEANVNSVMIGLDSYMNAGDVFNIQSSDGESVITFAPVKSYNNIVLCTDILETGKEYILSVGGSVEGEAVDGVYSGKYTGGSVYEAFTITENISTVGNASSGMMPGGMPGGFPNNPGQKPGGGGR